MEVFAFGLLTVYLNFLRLVENTGKLPKIGIMVISLAMVLGFLDPVYTCHYN